MSEQEADHAAIVELIHRNRIALWTADYELYASCFVHSPDTARWNASPILGIHVRYGWDEISARVRDFFNTNAGAHGVSLANAHETTVENLVLHIDRNTAWATFNQRFPTPKQVISGRGFTHEVRIFERHDDAWKIVFLGYLDEDFVRDDSVMVQLDREGRVLYETTGATLALASDDDLIIRNGKLRVRDSRTNERLQSGIQWAASLDRGYILSKSTLAIVHDAGDGLPAKVWWIIAESGRIWFAFGDAGLSDARLSAAAAAFGLSPAQLEVARHIAQGQTLTQIADRLGITPNTARTHLDRIFDKTGVRTQPALVRMLLTVVSPA
jgi:DNA-binding CsgD family transcriptional regulator